MFKFGFLKFRSGLHGARAPKGCSQCIPISWRPMTLTFPHLDCPCADTSFQHIPISSFFRDRTWGRRCYACSRRIMHQSAQAKHSRNRSVRFGCDGKPIPSFDLPHDLQLRQCISNWGSYARAALICTWPWRKRLATYLFIWSLLATDCTMFVWCVLATNCTGDDSTRLRMEHWWINHHYHVPILTVVSE
jgi:hypothetical protein